MSDVSFYNLSFSTAPGRVMTPRSTTERLVERALERIGGRPLRVADVGTGSGAIAITLALVAPEIEVWASDASPEAVELARANAARHGLCGRVHVVEGDLLEPIPRPLDLVVANLPYLPERLAGTLAHRDLDADPPASVFAPGDGLGPYRRLLAAAESRLADDGALVLQLRGRVVEAERDELRDLREQLADLWLDAA